MTDHMAGLTEQSHPRWQQHQFRAMNTRVYLWFYGPECHLPGYIEDLFRYFEMRLSRFHPASELYEFNRTDTGPVPVSADLYEAVEAALSLAEATNGIFDPTILNDLTAAGYDRSFEQIEATAPYYQVRRMPAVESARSDPARVFSYRNVILDERRREIYRPPGLRLDLGGMGKGWTVDRASEELFGQVPFLLNAGGDIFADGSLPDGTGWEIDIVHPFWPRKSLATVRLGYGGMATSTVARRRWIKNGAIMHHLIDPHTGRPAQSDVVSASVLSTRTVLAEVFAKVAVILGSEAGMEFLRSLPDVEGLIFTTDGRARFTDGMAAHLSRLDEGDDSKEMPVPVSEEVANVASRC